MTEEQLNQLSIFALRELARRMGVVSPTSKKKEELVNSILKIEDGTLQPCLNKTKQGRPPKSFGYEFNHFSPDDKSKVFALKQNSNQSFAYQDVKTTSGFLDFVGSNSAYLWVKNDFSKGCYFVDAKILSAHNFKQGDKVVAELNVENNQRIVEEILNINDCPIANFDEARADYFELEHKLPNKVLPFEDKIFKKLGIKFGENVFVYGSNNSNNTVKTKELVNSLKDMRKIYLNVSMAERNKVLLSGFENAEMFVCDLLETKDVALRTAKLAVEYAKRCMEKGENVALIVDDLQSVMAFDDENMLVTKSLVSLAKNAENKGSITLFAISQNMQTPWLEKLCDKRLQIDEDNIALKM